MSNAEIREDIIDSVRCGDEIIYNRIRQEATLLSDPLMIIPYDVFESLRRDRIIEEDEASNSRLSIYIYPSLLEKDLNDLFL